jgi:hypothetical protein
MEEVIKMSGKKNTCDCGCIPPVRQAASGSTKEKEAAKARKGSK